MKQDKYLRNAYIEARLLWGGGVTAADVARQFGIARQNAQAAITAYRRDHPGNLLYDRKRRRQVKGQDFTPHYIHADVSSFLDHVRGQAMMGYFLEQEHWAELPFEDIDRHLRRRLNSEVIHEVIAGLSQQRSVAIIYQSKKGARHRTISPHYLVFATSRYHVRGYCHLRREYRDFVLSRIQAAHPGEEEWILPNGDLEWNEYVTLRFKPNPTLPVEAHEALVSGYPLEENGCYQVRCRKATRYYLEQEFLGKDPTLGIPLWLPA